MVTLLFHYVGYLKLLKAEVQWNQATQTVTATKGSTVIKLVIGKSTATINGKIVTLAAKAEVINGSTMVPLRFVAEALGAKVSWDAGSNTAVIKSVTTEVGGGQVVSGIKVQYGKHDYGNKNQTEYDKSMKIVKDAVAKYSSTEFDGGGKFAKQFEMYLNGEKYTDYASGSMNYMGLKIAEAKLGALVNAGVNKADVEKLHKAGLIAGDLIRGVNDPGDGSPSSLYDLLVRGVTDCDPDAHAFSAVYDSLGYETMVIGGAGHADMFVKVGDSWYTPMGGTFVKGNFSGGLNSGSSVIAAPTYGSSF